MGAIGRRDISGWTADDPADQSHPDLRAWDGADMTRVGAEMRGGSGFELRER